MKKSLIAILAAGLMISSTSFAIGGCFGIKPGQATSYSVDVEGQA